jgi:hypothetical protein
MKKLGMFVLVAALLGFVQYAQAQEVSSVNVVGFYKVETAPGGQFTLCALQFDAIDPANANIVGVFGTNNLRKGAVPTSADRVYLWDTGSSTWKQYFQKANGSFYDANVPPWTTPTNPPMVAGQGFFIQSPSSSTTTNTITFAGEVVDVATQLTSVVSGFQTLGYPFSSATGLADMTLRAQGTAGTVPSAADRVYVYDPVAGYVQYWLKSTDRQWRKASEFPLGNPQNPAIALGQGFWYQAKNGFTWAETNAYLNNL